VSGCVVSTTRPLDLGVREVMMDFTVVCDAPTGCVFDLARRKAPEHYKLVASYRWWGSSRRGRKPARTA
jgi:hypothetical protein